MNILLSREEVASLSPGRRWAGCMGLTEDSQIILDFLSLLLCPDSCYSVSSSVQIDVLPEPQHMLLARTEFGAFAV